MKAAVYNMDFPDKGCHKAESNWNSKVISKSAVVLCDAFSMSDMNVHNPFNPENIEVGQTSEISHRRRFNGDLTLVLAAYNAGPKTVGFGYVPDYETAICQQGPSFTAAGHACFNGI
jgi:hypothetical protein